MFAHIDTHAGPADVADVEEVQHHSFPSLLHADHARAEQIHENDLAKVVITCEPEGAHLMMGALHPRASLYERPVNLEEAQRAHANFRQLLRSNGCKVLTLREILKFDVETSVTERMRLEAFAMRCLTYKVADDCKAEDLDSGSSFYVSDDYKKQVMREMSTEQLIDTILIHPTVTIHATGRDTGFMSTYSFQPLSNLVYMRDQQITTCKGVVLGSLRSQQRQLEVELMDFAFHKLGIDPVGQIDKPGFLEGGDFFPAGRDLALLGVGLRSNYEAARQLMDRDLLGTTRFAVVRDDFDKHQDRMHLDCVFSILTGDCCLMLEDMMGDSSPTRRLVDLWVRDRRTGKYKLDKEGVEFAKFMSDEGYAIMPVKGSDQLKYGCNCLNLGSGRIVAVHEDTARNIVNFEGFDGHVQYIDWSSITSMYGAVHCGSQVILRLPVPDESEQEGTQRNAKRILEGSQRGAMRILEGSQRGSKRIRM